jgi:LPXTG-motif cell wall-anchored protein
MTSRLGRTAALTALTLSVSFGLAGNASAQEPCPTDQHSGVCSVQGQRDGGTVRAAAATPARASSSLPLTGTDVVTTAAVGGGLIALGTVLSRRRRAVDGSLRPPAGPDAPEPRSGAFHVPGRSRASVGRGLRLRATRGCQPTPRRRAGPGSCAPEPLFRRRRIDRTASLCVHGHRVRTPTRGVGHRTRCRSAHT